MSIVSSADHWLFISSTGGLTAGRINAESALFPYYTDDKVSENSVNTGPVTCLRVQRGGQSILWEPFSTCSRLPGSLTSTRNLYKNVAGDKLVFEEINHDSRPHLSLCLAHQRPLRLRAHRLAAQPRGRTLHRPPARRRAEPPALWRHRGPADRHEQPARRLQAQRTGSRHRPRHLRPQCHPHRPRRSPANRSRPPSPGRSASLPPLICSRTSSLEAFRAGPSRRRRKRTSRAAAALTCFSTTLDLGSAAPNRAGASWPMSTRTTAVAALLNLLAGDRQQVAGLLEQDIARGSTELAEPGCRRRRPPAVGRPADHCPSLRQRHLQHHARRHLRRQRPCRQGGFARFRPRAQPHAAGPNTPAAAFLGGLPDSHLRRRSLCPRCRHRRARPDPPLLRVPAAHLQPPPRRPQPALEPVLDQPAPPRWPPPSRLPGQLARHLPELGTAWPGPIPCSRWA